MEILRIHPALEARFMQAAAEYETHRSLAPGAGTGAELVELVEGMYV